MPLFNRHLEDVAWCVSNGAEESFLPARLTPDLHQSHGGAANANRRGVRHQPILPVLAESLQEGIDAPAEADNGIEQKSPIVIICHGVLP